MARTLGWAALSLCVLALAAVTAQDRAGTAGSSSALETMLAGYVCDQLPTPPDPNDPSARERCTGDQRQALRAEFGFDLSRLSPAERGKLDASCSHLRDKVDVDPYVKCLAHGLASLRPKWAAGRLTQPGLPTPTGVVAQAPAPAAAAATPQGSSMVIPIAAGVGLVVAVVGVVVAKKMRGPKQVCRECGAAMEGTGDLCPDCRHRAAAALKQAKIDQAEHDRTEKDRQRRLQAEVDDRQRQAEELEA